VLTGLRRSGKTTLLNLLLSDIPGENKIYFDLEKLNNRELFSQKNYDHILDSLGEMGLNLKRKMYIALDEIQLLPNIVSIIKYLYDHNDIKFLVTGSSSYYLKNLFSESLAGRKLIFELFPLDFGEFLTFKNVRFNPGGDILAAREFNAPEYQRVRALYEEYIAYGGFPEVVLAASAKQKKDLAQDIISSYVSVDIKSFVDFRDERNIYNLIKLLASRIGCRLDYSKLASLAGLSRITVMDYLDLFEKTYLISRLPVFTKNPGREIAKAQKLYFCDNGLVNVLAQNSGGAQFENAVFNQLRGHGELRYYALKTGREIDFILNKQTALECKETPTAQDMPPLSALAKVAGIKKYRLIGRRASPKFSGFIWGGMIR
jgi:predicted AAA+ superfamily ATPase